MADVHIVNYATGNIRSIIKSIELLGASWKVAESPQDLKQANRIILPGVGHFDTALAGLEKAELTAELTQKFLNAEIPILGICLGMQVLLQASDEGNLCGLGFIPGRLERFPSSPGSTYHALHVGWNTLDYFDSSHPIFHSISAESEFYFVHSYFLASSDSPSIIAKTRYGIEFASAIGKEATIGVQFHPEKSRKSGAQLLQNFLRI
jgi:glutamine amidotransferase